MRFQTFRFPQNKSRLKTSMIGFQTTFKPLPKLSNQETGETKWKKHLSKR
ncbi:hypothetical protein MCC93_00170 [Morococcus cerebrosus]|uniref:Uncharacterized protein n=1 Tax=Morococcus cerebrosus TaxID=1056807 RepID=A0A0C1EM08_9NEIS|nr:hypothetical protein MCC93_00170 [Morococcus cerebrosus]